MPMTLYCSDASAPSRAVYLCLEALDLHPERKSVKLLNGEHLTAEFIKLNPQHTIPTLIDDEFVIWDSHAINAYLVGKYAKDDSLYPKDLEKRAVVDQRLHFDTGVLFPRLRDITYPMAFLDCKEIPAHKRQKVMEAYEVLEQFLQGREFAAGDEYSIADFSCVSTVTTLTDGLRISVDDHPNIKNWLQRCKESLPGYQEAQQSGLEHFRKLADTVLGQ